VLASIQRWQPLSNTELTVIMEIKLFAVFAAVVMLYAVPRLRVVVVPVSSGDLATVELCILRY